VAARGRGGAPASTAVVRGPAGAWARARAAATAATSPADSAAMRAAAGGRGGR